MSSDRTTSPAELLLDLDPSAGRKGETLRQALRRAIAEGGLQPGARLPSSRVLAADLGVSRGVVVEAYEQLAAEGWLLARHGSGNVVADHPSAAGPSDRVAGAPTADDPAAADRVAALDLRPARPDVSVFPRTAWVAATRAVLADLPHTDLSYGDHRGHPRARAVVAAYLARVRGVRTTADRVVLTGGFSSGLVSVVTALGGRGIRRIAVEDPGGYEPRRRVQVAGAAPVPVPVDAEGLDVDALDRTGAQAVLVTPAHQYPMGVVLSAGRRGALAEWARRRDGWVLEDDYDAEFRYDREPIGAVQGLVPERTIHLGSVAKTLAPSVRVGWVVVPASLLADVVDAHEARSSQPATLEHLTLAHLVDGGAYDRHLRTVRRRYRERRDVLLAALAEAGLGGRLEGVAAGMQAVLRLPDAADDEAVAAALAARGVALVPLSRYAIRSSARGLVIGFGQPTPSALRTAAGTIADVLRSTT